MPSACSSSSGSPRAARPRTRRTHMKRLAACLALVASGLIAAAALATTEVTRFQADPKSKKPGKSTSLKVGLSFADPDQPSQRPESLDHFTIRLNRGTVLDPGAAPTCAA